jgi:hypothetical protein
MGIHPKVTSLFIAILGFTFCYGCLIRPFLWADFYCKLYWWKTGLPGENHLPATSHWQTLSHNAVKSTPHLSGIQTHKVSDDMHWLSPQNAGCLHNVFSSIFFLLGIPIKISNGFTPLRLTLLKTTDNYYCL